MIYKLLEPKVKTNLAILNEIYNNNSWTKTSFISEELDISERTVQHYFKDIFSLKEAFDEDTPNDLKILYFKTKGIRIIDYKNEFEDFKKFTIQNSLTIILLQDIINHRMTSVANYSQKYFISETTVRKNLKRIKEACQYYGLDIYRFQLTGDEEKIRFFISLVSKMTNREPLYQIEGIDYNKIEDVFTKFFTEMNIKLSQMKKIRLINRFLIHLQRISLNKKVTFDDSITMTFKKHDFYPAIRALFNQYLVFDEREITFYFYVISLDHELSRNEVTNIVYRHSQKNDLPIYTHTIAIFNQIKGLLKPLTPSESETITQNLFYINYLTMKYDDLVFDYKYSMNVQYDLSRHPSLCKKITQLLQEHLIDQKLISDREINTLLQQYLFRLLYFIDPSNLDKVINIYIEPSFDSFQQQQIKEYLDLFFNHQVCYLDTFDEDVADMVLTPYHETYQKLVYPSKLVTMIKFPLSISLLKVIETKLTHPKDDLEVKYEIY